MKIQGMMKKAAVAALAVVITAGASGFAAAPASVDTLQSSVSASQETGATSKGSMKVSAEGWITSVIFYNHLRVSLVDGHKFVGNGGGGMNPGGGGFVGHVYTEDYDRLFRDTVSYQVNVTGFYVNVNFFDSSSNLLGHMHASNVGTVWGIGGGKGSWTR